MSYSIPECCVCWWHYTRLVMPVFFVRNPRALAVVMELKYHNGYLVGNDSILAQRCFLYPYDSGS